LPAERTGLPADNAPGIAAETDDFFRNCLREILSNSILTGLIIIAALGQDVPAKKGLPPENKPPVILTTGSAWKPRPG